MAGTGDIKTVCLQANFWVTWGFRVSFVSATTLLTSYHPVYYQMNSMGVALIDNIMSSAIIYLYYLAFHEIPYFTTYIKSHQWVGY